MPATLRVQLSLEDLASAIASLNLEEKKQLLDTISQQIFEAEEALYEDDPNTQIEIQAVKAEYDAGKYLTLDEYLTSHS